MRLKFMWGMVLILVGVGVMAGWWSYAKNYTEHVKATRSQWPTVQGTVLDSWVNDYRDDRLERLVVKFAYEVDGVQYFAEQSGLVNERFLDAITFQAPNTYGLLGKYWPGRTVTVYYDPTNPVKAEIWAMADDWWLVLFWLAMCFGAVPAIIGAALLIPGKQQVSGSS